MYDHVFILSIDGRNENSSEVIFRQNFSSTLLDQMQIIGLYDLFVNPKSLAIEKAEDLIKPIFKGLYIMSGLDANHTEGEMRMSVAFNIMQMLIKCINTSFEYPNARVLVTE